MLFRWLIVGTLAASSALAGEAVTEESLEKMVTSELILDDARIKDVVLVDPSDRSPIERRRGSSLFVPPGRYRIERVALKSGFTAWPSYEKGENWIDLSPEKPYRFRLGPSPEATLTAARSGRTLTLACELSDSDGWLYRAEGDAAAPQFAVYCGDEKIGSGSFKYG